MKRIHSISAVAGLAACVFLLGHLRESTVYGANPPPEQEPAAASSDVGRMATVRPPSVPTWSRDVGSILYKNCATCHHPGGAGPFSLLTYNDAKRWGPQLMVVTQSRFMPPWLPEPGYGDFADVRRLSDHDRALIKLWVEDKMPQGDPAIAPEPPHYDANWLMGKPDLILKVARPFTLPGGGTDVFRNFILPYPLTQTHYIRAMEIRPGTPQIVHHANITIDRTGSLRRQFPNDWQSGISGMDLMVDAGSRFDPDSHFLFWKPDTPALIEPEGMPWRLDPGNDLILNMHLKPSGKAETLDAEVGLYFTPNPPAKQPMLISLDRDDALDIPAGAANFVVEDSLTLPVDLDVLGVYPHAHYLGRDMQGWAILPDGKKKWLIWIRNWDIDRQAVYRYKDPVPLPKGTVLHMRYIYDNSPANVHNPHAPPVRVRAGNRSEDEMAHLWFQVLPVNVQPGAPDPRLLLEETWMRNRLSKTPNDQVSLYNLAASLAGQGKFTEAVPAFEKELNQSPRDVRTLTALGAALEGAGEWQQAQQRFRSAIEAAGTDDSSSCDPRFDLASSEVRHGQPEAAEEFRMEVAACPNDAEALTGLGQIEIEANQTTQAVQHLTAAIRIDPSLAEAHEQLARAYAQSGDLLGALAELEKAAELKPDDATIHSGLSQVLAATGSLQQAIAEQQTALKLLEDDADGWNNLGVLEARTGQLPAARDAFQHALRLDPQHPQAKSNLAHLQTQN
ncbi:MAG: tetratricopeptide repeat protein [Terracidiphilus sp.]|jgi:Flp pilus assembly protein TadD/mono/diheme cytochrome c family protein